MMRTPPFWQSLNVTSAVLLPLGLLYYAGAWLDRHLSTAKRAPLPVISVGNVTAGGAGKTPVTLTLAALLQAQGYIPHIATRGYGGAAQTAHRVTPQDSWREVGDEALLLQRTAPTWVGKNRLAAAHAAHNAGATALLLDDGLQHHALKKDLSLLVIDGAYGLGNHLPLPAGPLREPLACALKRCDAVIMIGEDAQHVRPLISLPIFNAHLVPEKVADTMRIDRWIAFAGIGRPEKFFTTLRTHGLTVVAQHAFADHHPYSDAELDTLRAAAREVNARLITTEKDWVRLPEARRAEISTFPVTLQFEDAASFTSWLIPRLISPSAEAI